MTLRKLFTQPIVFYRKYISPRKSSPCCKYLPTCSDYAIQAIEEWGIFCGCALAAWRILRCNPFSKGGLDPIPLRKKRKARPEDIKEKDKIFSQKQRARCEKGDTRDCDDGSDGLN